MSRSLVQGWITVAVFGLVVMATWTLVIKFLAPALHAIANDMPVADAPFMWDFWWAAHLILAWLLWQRHRLAWVAGVAISVVEIVIVVVKFALFAQQPDGSFWALLWLTNKVYVLAYFVALLSALVTPTWRRALRAGG